MTANMNDYLYRPLLRPASGFTLPRGITWRYVEAPALDPLIGSRLGIPVSVHNHGVIAIDRKLSQDEADTFSLELVG